MTIDKEPFYQERKYWGSIHIPTITDVFTNQDGSIPFTITMIEDRSSFNKQDWREIHHYEFSLKTKKFTTIKGKLKAFIISKIESDIIREKIKL